MNKTETCFRTIMTWFGGLPGIIVPLGIIFIMGLVSYYNHTYLDGPVAYLGVNNDIILSLLVGFGGVFISFAVGTIIKYMYYKPRPIPWDISTTWSKINASSMPSIHSSNSLICAVSFVMMIASIETTILNILLSIVIAVYWFMSISLSRIALGKHYPIDVLAGSIFGLIISIVISSHSEQLIILLQSIISQYS